MVEMEHSKQVVLSKHLDVWLSETMLLLVIIVFIILVTINFVVITKGSGRIAEVSARFTLDAMLVSKWLLMPN